MCGILGSGMAHLGTLALQAGHTVSGSDTSLIRISRPITLKGVKIYSTHEKTNIAGADMFVRSLAIPDDNVEYLEAIRRGITVLTRAEFLNLLVKDKIVIGVAGSFGKSSTATLIKDALDNSDLNPTIYIGANGDRASIGARYTQTDLALVEACEYKGEITKLKINHLVVTSLGQNHEDYFGEGADGVIDYFSKYISDNKRELLSIWLNTADANVARLGAALADKNIAFVSYGGIDAQWRISRSQTDLYGVRGSVINGTEEICDINLPWFGYQSLLNSLPAVGLSLKFGIELAEIAANLAESRPPLRRFERKGYDGNIHYFDDNARQPEQIAISIKTARESVGSTAKILVVIGIWGKLNKRNLPAYASALMGCDYVYLLPSTNFEQPIGVEPPQADRRLLELLEGNRIKAEIFKDNCIQANTMLQKDAVVLTIGYDSYLGVFSKIWNSVSSIAKVG